MEVDEFAIADPASGGPMMLIIALRHAGDGTEPVALHDDLPPGVAPADNETEWRQALARLAALVESRGRGADSVGGGRT